MNKKDLVRKVALDAGLTMKKAEEVLDGFLTGISSALSKGEEISVRGFGKFCVIDKKARQGRNPKTGTPVAIPAKKMPKFVPGAELKRTIVSKKKKK